jgi:transcriptional regulator with XRE-family HTH domain
MDNMNYGKLGKRINEERVKRHISREKMAEDLNISTSYVGHIERGERCLTVETLVNIASYFKLSVDYLLRDSMNLVTNDLDEAWNKLIDGKTSEEKQALIDVFNRINKLSEK